jgi:hypothetical protein
MERPAGFTVSVSQIWATTPVVGIHPDSSARGGLHPRRTVTGLSEPHSKYPVDNCRELRVDLNSPEHDFLIFWGVLALSSRFARQESISARLALAGHSFT